MGQLQHVEEHVRELLRGVYVEVLTRRRVYLVRHGVNLRAQALGLLPQLGGVRIQARPLHAQKHRQEGHLHLPEDAGGAVLLHEVGKDGTQLAHGKGAYARGGDRVRCVRQWVTQVLGRQVRHRIGGLVRIQQVGGHTHVKDAGRVHVLRLYAGRQGGVQGAGRSGLVHAIGVEREKCLHVLAGDLAQAHQRDQGHVRVVPVKAQEPTLA